MLGGNAEFGRPIIAKTLRLSSTGHKTERLNAAFYGKCILSHNVYFLRLILWAFILISETAALINALRKAGFSRPTSKSSEK